MNFSVKLADTVFGLTTVYTSSKQLCEAFLSSEPIHRRIEVTDMALNREKERLKQKGLLNTTPEMLEEIALCGLVANLLPLDNTVLMHASCVRFKDTSYLFCGPSGIGKSTHARLWVGEFGADCDVINDDKPLIKVTDRALIAFGSPWNGKHFTGKNSFAPVGGICVLKQAPINRITRLSLEAGLDALKKCIFRPENYEAFLATATMAVQISTLVPVYLLECNAQPEAAHVAFDALHGKE